MAANDGKLEIMVNVGDFYVKYRNYLDYGLIKCISNDGTKIICEGLEDNADGTKVASGSTDNTVQLWDVSSGALLHTLEGHSDTVESVSFSPDGTKLASGSWDRKVKLWNVTSGECLQTLEPSSGRKPRKPSSGRKLTKYARKMQNARGHSLEVNCVSFSPDGRKVASGSDDKKVKVWDVTTGECVTLEGHSRKVNCVSFSSDGTKVASGSSDRTVKLWDVTSGVELCSFYGHFDEVTSVSFSPDGTKVASGSNDNTVKLWDVPNEVELYSLNLNPNREIVDSRLFWEYTVLLHRRLHGLQLFISGYSSLYVHDVTNPIRLSNKQKNSELGHLTNDDGASEPQQKRQKTHELEHLCLRF